MNYSDKIEVAKNIAFTYHQGQHRWNGSDYINHPSRVANMVEPLGPVYQMVAWLHDTLEDTPLTVDIINDELELPQVTQAVIAMTKKSDEHYFEDYLPRVKANKIAKKVKLYDVIDNCMDLLDNYPHKLKSINKYQKAMSYLMK